MLALQQKEKFEESSKIRVEHEEKIKNAKEKSDFELLKKKQVVH